MRFLIILIIGFIAVKGQAAESLTAELSIKPNPALANEAVTLTCLKRDASNSKYGKVAYVILKDGIQKLKADKRCGNDPLVIAKNEFPNSAPIATCDNLTLNIAKAQRDDLSGEYKCQIAAVATDFQTKNAESNSVSLKIGDKTPPIQKFEIKNLQNSQSITNNTVLFANTNLSIFCQTPVSNPMPEFTVTITDKETRYNRTVNNEVKFYEVLPRTPVVKFVCEVFNGFGNKQQQTITIKSNYTAGENDITIAKNINAKSDKEITICSASNNPPKRMSVEGLDKNLIAAGYPKFTEANGISEIRVKFNNKVKMDKPVDVQCSIGGVIKIQKVSFTNVRVLETTTTTTTTSANGTEASDDDIFQKLLQLIYNPTSPMMMIAIVIAALIAFLVIVAVLAYICKRKDAANKDNNGGKAPYSSVKQDEAAKQSNVEKLNEK